MSNTATSGDEFVKWAVQHIRLKEVYDQFEFANDATNFNTMRQSIVNKINKIVKELPTPIEGEKERLAYLEALINSPEIDDFLKGVQVEAAHQTERWSVEAEEKKMPHHYACVMAKLTGKLAVAIFDGNTDKYKHHLITLAAVCFNIHRQVEKKGTLVNKYFHQNADSAPPIEQKTEGDRGC